MMEGSGSRRPKTYGSYGSGTLMVGYYFIVPYCKFSLFCFRKVYFDLMLEKQVFVHGMETLEEAISSFLHICFIANLRFPVGSGILSTFLQRWVAKLDENGTTADRIKKDQVSKQDKADRSFKKSFEIYTSKMYVLLRSSGMV
jgi:hypothetical protein